MLKQNSLVWNYTYLCCCLNHCSLAQFASSSRSTVVLAVRVHCANEVCIGGDHSIVRDIALQWHPEKARVCAILVNGQLGYGLDWR